PNGTALLILWTSGCYSQASSNCTSRYVSCSRCCAEHWDFARLRSYGDPIHTCLCVRYPATTRTYAPVPSSLTVASWPRRSRLSTPCGSPLASHSVACRCTLTTLQAET